MAEVQNRLNELMDNPIVVGILAIALTMYGPRLSPKLPDFIRDAFNSGFFRFLIIALVIFVGFRSIRLAIVVAVLFLMIMSISNQQSIKEDFNKQVNEYYANYNLYHLGNVEHFENANDEPQVGNDRQNDTQGLYDNDEEGDDASQDDNTAPVNINLNKELQPIIDLANNPKIGMSAKCRAYWNTFANDTDGCLQELEIKVKENPQLVSQFKPKNNSDNSLGMGNKLKDIEKKIGQACAAFKGQH